MIRFENIEPLNLRMQRTPAAGFAERAHRMLRPGEDRFDIAVAAITHPAGDATCLGMPLREGAKADALHAAAHSYADDFF